MCAKKLYLQLAELGSKCVGRSKLKIKSNKIPNPYPLVSLLMR